ncbi:MAG: helicase [Gemmatimonadetes bacterium]|nr:helicase [Gemmatimonadota bacterium]
MSRLGPGAQSRLAAEIRAAGGREVSFVADLDGDGVVITAVPVARGTVSAVLALPGVAARGQMVLHNHPSGVLEPSPADLAVAARLHDAGIGFGIVNNPATEMYVVVEVPRAPAYQGIDPVETARALGPGGLISRVLGAFEDRPSQRDMAAYVADTFNQGGVSLLEAGTGVGKSFAYLVPAIAWARANRERTIVSTNTINLQEQLVGKDLPLLARALGDDDEPLTYALLKGWRNYLCLARLELAQSGQASLLEPERQEELDALAAWARRTTDGSLADLTDQPSDDVWDEISAEADLCTRLDCPHFDRCFVFAARRRAAEADLVVVNHHLLASDLAVRRAQENWQEAAVLPPYRRLIVDEAHHLEDAAAEHLGAAVSARGVTRLLGRLERNGRGLIPALLGELAASEGPLAAASTDLLRQGLLPEVAQAKASADEVFRLLAERLAASGESVFRLSDGFAADPLWEQGLEVALDNLVASLGRLRDGVETIADRLEVDHDRDHRAQRVQELRGVVRRLQAGLDGMLLTLRPQPGLPAVRWIERRGGPRSGAERGGRPVGRAPFAVALASVPLELAGVLRETLFDRVETIVLTSATLAVGDDFSFLTERLGLGDEFTRLKYQVVLPSPFDFAAQCLFGVPTDVPDPRSDEAGHDEAVAQAIVQLAHASEGGMFVLFTSHAALRRTADRVRHAVAHRWPLLVQGEGQRDQLLRRFREAGSAILLGTDSFWEGVDVPGPALRVLLLAKLPFKAPNEPLTAARLERLAEQGLDGFMHYLVPRAALKLKQGFGRLIRSRSDVGVVVLMDHRVVSRRYGAALQASLPPAQRVIAPWATVRSAVKAFFRGHAEAVSSEV